MKVRGFRWVAACSGCVALCCGWRFRRLPAAPVEAAGPREPDVSNVDVGMTQNQVLSILGQPQMREAYGPTEFLFYPGSSGSTVPVAIVDGKVTSIGRAAYEIVVQSKAQSASTASTPR